MNDTAALLPLEPLTIDEIDLDEVEAVIVRMSGMGAPAFIKMNQGAIATSRGTGYAARRRAFLTMIDDIVQNNSSNDIVNLDIVRWRDFEHTWHIHSGPIERHARPGDLVRLRYSPTEDTFIITQLGTHQGINEACIVHSEIRRSTMSVWKPLSELTYTDAPDIEVVL